MTKRIDPNLGRPQTIPPMGKTDAELLSDFVKQYPEHSDALLDLAISFVLAEEDEPAAPGDADNRVVSIFENRSR